MKGKTLLFLAASSMIFLGACSWSNRIPADAPATIEVSDMETGTSMDNTMEDTMDANVEISDDNVEAELDSFDAAIEKEEEIENLEADVDELFNEYEEIYQ